jgi:uncharacterized membrane protein
MLQTISKRELFQAQIALFIAIALQIVVWQAHHGFTQNQFFIIAIELAMVVIVSFSASVRTLHNRIIHRAASFILLALISAANISSLIIVLQLLVTGESALTGLQLLATALAIFVTNIIVFALWYWEIDSPGLSRNRWSKHDKDFQFAQQDIPKEFPDWHPEFADYAYLSITNAINFAPADTKPLTRQAKGLMAAQALVSVFTLALVIARSVSILGS